MLISIIIPIYNVEKYIERCICSITSQTFKNYEVILIDDASQDNSLKIAEKIVKDNHIIFQSIIHEENKGQSIARNKGIKVAKGKYIMFVDSDDALANNTVLEDFFKETTKGSYDFVAANHCEINYKNTKITNPYTGKIKKNRKVENEKIVKSFFDSKITVSSVNKLIKKDFLLQHKLFFKEGLVFEDELWTLELCMTAKKCYLLAECNYHYYQTNPKSTTKNTDKKSINDLFFIVQEILKKIEENNSFKTQNTHTVIDYYLAKNSTLLKRAITLNDKKLWIDYYKKLQENYTKSSLRKHKKSFYFSAETAYYIANEINQLKKTRSVFKQLKLNVLLILEMYNIRGIRVVINNIRERICWFQ